MQLYKTKSGPLLYNYSNFFLINENWDNLINRDNLESYLLSLIQTATQLDNDEISKLLKQDSLFPPIGQQEVWAAGVTYLKSRDARMEESQGSGAASLYDKV